MSCKPGQQPISRWLLVRGEILLHVNVRLQEFARMKGAVSMQSGRGRAHSSVALRQNRPALVLR